jgi:hypothetical protein
LADPPGFNFTLKPVTPNRFTVGLVLLAADTTILSAQALFFPLFSRSGQKFLSAQFAFEFIESGAQKVSSGALKAARTHFGRL